MASRDHRRQAPGAPPDRVRRPAGLTDIPDPAPGHPAPARPALRRRELFGAAAGVTAVALGALAPAARAQTAGSTSGSTPGSTPGSSPTTAPVGAEPAEKATVSGPDLELVRFARSIELALSAVYERAIDSGRLKATANEQANLGLAHHRAHAARMSEIGGSEVSNTPNPRLLAQLLPRVDATDSERALILLLQTTEDSAAATYLALLGDARDWQLAATFASISPVDAQQAVAWNRVALTDDTVWAAQVQTVLPTNQTTDGAWDPNQYPAGPA
jgi:hypothetical protein